MGEFKGNLIEKVQRTPSIFSFRFKIVGTINFLAGQFMKVIFDNDNRQNRDLNKYLSFSCAPGREYIEVTKRLSDSDFSQKLKSLKINDEVIFEGPLGKCVLEGDDIKVGFLSGGIGITPVISMIDDIVNRGLNADIILFYSNRSMDEIAFKLELDSWKSDKIKIVYTITDCKPEDAECVCGVINKDLLLRYAEEIKNRPFFIFGPPAMVTSMKNVCLEAGCDSNKIMAESFVGY